MKRIKLKHGTATVDDNISQDTIDALNRLSNIAYKHGRNLQEKPPEPPKSRIIREDGKGLLPPKKY